MVRLFAQSAKSATPALAVLTVAIAGGAMVWTPAGPVLLWALLMLPLLGARYALGSAFLKLRDPEKSARLWRVFFTLLEVGFGLRCQALADQVAPFPELPAVGFHPARLLRRESSRPIIGTKAFDQEMEFLDNLSAFREPELVAQLLPEFPAQRDGVRHGQSTLEGTAGFSRASAGQVVAAFA